MPFFFPVLFFLAPLAAIRPLARHEPAVTFSHFVLFVS